MSLEILKKTMQEPIARWAL